MRGELHPTRPTSAATAPDASDGLRVCVNIPGLNRAASQDLFWPSRVGQSEGYPYNYVCMPFGLLNIGASYQRLAQRAMASHEARRLAVMSLELPSHRESPEPRKPLEPPGS